LRRERGELRKLKRESEDLERERDEFGGRWR